IKVLRHDVRMAESCRHARFASESLAMIDGPRQLVPKHLDRHEAMQGDVPREIHHTHRSLAQLTNHLVIVAQVKADLTQLPRAWRRRCFVCGLDVRAGGCGSDRLSHM